MHRIAIMCALIVVVCCCVMASVMMMMVISLGELRQARGKYWKVKCSAWKPISAMALCGRQQVANGLQIALFGSDLCPGG